MIIPVPLSKFFLYFEQRLTVFLTRMMSPMEKVVVMGIDKWISIKVLFAIYSKLELPWVK